MRALFIEFKKVNLSLTYDGLTIYPKFDLSFKSKSKVVKNACAECKTIIKNKFKTKDGSHYSECHEKLKTQSNVVFDRVIRHKDEDHDFYHHDKLDETAPHFHLKFHQMLTRQQLSQLLDVFIKHKLMKELEKDTYLLEYDLRYKEARLGLLEQLKGHADQDEINIIKYIKHCTDNDILSDLHDYLLQPQFDYLRSDLSAPQQWVGVNQAGNVVRTSKTWAMIEKSISLQMAMTVTVHTDLSPELGAKVATQLSQTHTFFAIKRKATATAKNNKTFMQLSYADEKELKGSYRKKMS